jgi:hypothetical protein
MNRDTHNSARVFDLAAPVTIVKPAYQGRFQSMMVIVATIMPDEFFNIYDKTGPSMSN